jgi:hypothetical protein
VQHLLRRRKMEMFTDFSDSMLQKKLALLAIAMCWLLDADSLC